MGSGCTRSGVAACKPGARRRWHRLLPFSSSASSSTPAPLEEDIELPPFFAEILEEVERHQSALGGRQYFTDRPRIEKKVRRQELSFEYTDYEYVYLTVLGLAQLHLHAEEICRRNNGQIFTLNPGVQMLERVSGLTMHADRQGTEHLLRTAPAVLVEAFHMSKKDPAGPLGFFRNAFDRNADPCLEGRTGRMLAYLEPRRGGRRSDAVPPWEDVTLRQLPEGTSSLDLLGEHLRVFLAERTWSWSRERGFTYERAQELRFSSEHAVDFERLFNAATFEFQLWARGVVASGRRRQWESLAKGFWVPYPADMSAMLDRAHKQGLTETEIRLGPHAWRFTVDFVSMVQRSPKTGQEWPLRIVEMKCQPQHGQISKKELAAGIAYFVDLATLPPAPPSSQCQRVPSLPRSQEGSMGHGSPLALPGQLDNSDEQVMFSVIPRDSSSEADAAERQGLHIGAASKRRYIG